MRRLTACRQQAWDKVKNNGVLQMAVMICCAREA